MAILRYLILFAIAAGGVGLLVGSMADFAFRFQGWLGIVVFALALVGSGLLLAAVRTGRLPLRAWYVVPPVLAAAAALLADEHAVYSFVNLAPGMIGIGTALVSFAALQLWADRRGPRDWHGIVFLVAFLFAGAVLGQLAWLWR